MKKTSLKASLLTLLPLFSFAECSDAKVCNTLFIEYSNRMSVFSPTHQAYERIKPGALYIGIEAWAAGAISSQFNTTAIGEGEVRIGHNFFYNERDHFTPFVGGGIFSDFADHDKYSWSRDEWGHFHFHHSSHKLPAVGYGTIGIRYDHEFGSIFKII